MFFFLCLLEIKQTPLLNVPLYNKVHHPFVKWDLAQIMTFSTRGVVYIQACTWFKCVFVYFCSTENAE
jgi:hypothetical protein